MGEVCDLKPMQNIIFQDRDSRSGIQTTRFCSVSIGLCPKVPDFAKFREPRFRRFGAMTVPNALEPMIFYDPTMEKHGNYGFCSDFAAALSKHDHSRGSENMISQKVMRFPYEKRTSE